jgi:phosphate transport system protein
MSIHLEREIGKLKKTLLSLCAAVEEQVQIAVRALLDRDADTAREVEQRDKEIDNREVDVEEECLKLLALHQPVAVDLRFIVAAMKMNNDLERIGDLAVNIARKALTLSEELPIAFPFDLAEMSTKTQTMLRDSLDALVNIDATLASDVCARDDEVDQMKRDIRQWGEQMLRTEPGRVTSVLALMATARNLERIADHATNIAEDVVYMAHGDIVRHGGLEA